MQRFHPMLRLRAVLLFACCLAAVPAAAAWSNAPSLALAVSTTASMYPMATSDGNGGLIVAWTDMRAGDWDVYAQHVLANGAVDPAWPAGGRAVCTALNYQTAGPILADGAGGAFITWADARDSDTMGGNDIYVHHVLASGALDPAWPAAGRAATTVAQDQSDPQVATDGAGGVIVAWKDSRTFANGTDIYAMRVRANGTVDPAWTANGVAVCTALNPQAQPKIMSDGSGGVFICWQDRRSGTDYDIYAQHLLSTGQIDGTWVANGLWISGAGGDQTYPVLTSDGAGGFFVAWEDMRSGTNSDIYAEHILRSGNRDPYWPYAEAPVCTTTNDQLKPVVAGDDAGGFFVAWIEYNWSGYTDISLQHMRVNGTRDAAWPAGGMVVCDAPETQTSPVIVADGTGGALLAWVDARDGGYDVYAQHATAKGAVAAGWSANGMPMATGSGAQNPVQVVADGGGGLLAAFLTNTGLTTYVQAQRMGPFGRLGSPEPAITSVKDVRYDQGGHVKVSWTASYLDTQRDSVLAAYDVLRSVPASAAVGAKAAGAVRTAGDGLADLQPGQILAVDKAGAATYWEYLGTQAAMHFTSSYSYVAATTCDSLAGANPLTTFMVLGHSANGMMYWPSGAASGYSVDNLPPSAPTALAGNWVRDVSHLSWSPNLEADLAGYRVYRGASASFTPGPASLVATSTLPRCDVTGDAAWFKVTAIDAHGNESAAGTLAPNAISAVDGVHPVFMFAAPAPNPMSGATTLAFSLAQPGLVQLVVHDLAGRRVRTIIDESLAAGAHQERWDLRDDAGHRVGAGMYVARLVTADGVRTQRMVVVP